MYKEGTATIPRCGGDVVEMKQRFFVTEPRLLNPDEQKSFCEKVVNAMGDISVRCVVLDQILAATPSTRRSRKLNEEFTLDIMTEITSDETGVSHKIVETTNDPVFQADAVDAIEMEVTIEEATVITSSPTSSPTQSPSSSPTRTAVCSIFTSGMFNSLVASPNAVYTYSGFCAAVNDWNTNNPNAQIFMEGSEMDRKHELSAFFGNTLHETGDFAFARESAVCGTNVEVSGVKYCQPNGYSSEQGDYTDQYCASSLTPSTDPDGCACTSSVSDNGSGYAANKLFFGRGPIQLSPDPPSSEGGSFMDCPLIIVPSSNKQWHETPFLIQKPLHELKSAQAIPHQA